MLGMLRKLLNGDVAQGVINVSANGDPAFPVPFFQRDLIGNTHGFYPDKARGFTFGKRTLIGNTKVDLWQGPTALYIPPASPIQMQVQSTAAADTIAGANVQVVMLHYLDSQWRQQVTTFNMNGLTAVVSLPVDILRVNGFHAVQVGSYGASAAGDITLTNIGGAVTYGVIKAGDNTARQAFYSTPDGYQGYISKWQTSSGSTGTHFCQTTLTATCHENASWPGVFLMQDEFGSQNGGADINLDVPIPIPPRTDVKLSAYSDASNANVTALGSITGWFEKL